MAYRKTQIMALMLSLLTVQLADLYALHSSRTRECPSAKARFCCQAAAAGAAGAMTCCETECGHADSAYKVKSERISVLLPLRVDDISTDVSVAFLARWVQKLLPRQPGMPLFILHSSFLI